MVRNILVTGSEGYIGSVLVNRLIKKGYKVTGLDSDFYRISKEKMRIKYRLIRKDIRKINKTDLKGIDAIIHLAGLSNDPTGELNKNLTSDINYKATIKLAKLAKSLGIKRFLFSSSCSIYGIAESGIVNENSPVNPLTAYAKSKINSEKDLIKLADDKFTIGILRNSTVYGYSPNLRVDLVVNNLTATAVTENEIKVKSDGTPWRPLIDVRDLSDIFIAFLNADKKNINARIFNIGFNENNFQVKEILSKIHKILPKCKITFTGEHGADSRSYKVNFELFKKTFPSIVQKWPIEESVKNLIKEIKKRKNYTKDIKNGKYTRLDVIKKLITQKKISNLLYFK